MRETKDLEFKENVTNTFLKTVTAYANYSGGRIMFGVNDNGEAVGIANLEQTCLDIENKINDSISPVPNYFLDIDNKLSVITLTVEEGKDKPYFYKSKAYKRNDSATIEVGRLELTRLIMEGQNMHFEELPYNKQDLTFEYLDKAIEDVMGFSSVSKDIYTTLNLSSKDDGFNNAGALFADVNSFYGIDMVRFGKDIDTILDRDTYSNISILKQYELALQKFRQYYQYEKIVGATRDTFETIPEKAFREAIANSLVHREWDINSHITVSMYEDKIEIVSPGGLIDGIDEDTYQKGGISILRNPIIANVFFRLHYIEAFGTGIRRIKQLYKKSTNKPIFECSNSSIRIILPVLSSISNLTSDEKKVYEVLKDDQLSISQIVKLVPFGKSKVTNILNELIKKGTIKKIGLGRGTKYTKVD